MQANPIDMGLMVEFPALSLVTIHEWKEKRERPAEGKKGQQPDKKENEEKRKRWLLVII